MTAEYRLRLAGAPRVPFTADAIEAIHRVAKGTPRVINTVCDNALYEAFLARQHEIDGRFIERIARDLGLEVEAAPVAARPETDPQQAAVAPAPPASAVDLSDIDRYLESLSKN